MREQQPWRQWVAAVRSSHGLEHATVAVLLARHGPTRLAGRATADGFYLFSRFPPEEVRSAADEALTRMRSGEPDLAVSVHCGTNIAVTGALTAIACAAVLSRGRIWSQLPNAILASMIAVVAAQPLGRAVQQHITTSAAVQDVEISTAQRVIGPLLRVRTSMRG